MLSNETLKEILKALVMGINKRHHNETLYRNLFDSFESLFFGPCTMEI